MKIAIMQPYLFPYVGYFQMINAAEKFVFYDDVQYIQRGWINRNYILTKTGKQLFTIPTKKSLISDNINDVFVLEGTAWKEKLLKTFFFTYKKAPRFKQVNSMINSVLSAGDERVVSYSIHSVEAVLDYLGMKREFILSSSLNYNREADKVQKLNEIIMLLGGKEFVLPPGSINLYDKSDFNIPTFFLETNSDILYPQFSKTRFEPNLSIIDILMFNSPDIVLDMLKRYELK